MTNPRTRVGSFRLNKNLELEFGPNFGQNHEIVFFTGYSLLGFPTRYFVRFFVALFLYFVWFFFVGRTDGLASILQTMPVCDVTIDVFV